MYHKRTTENKDFDTKILKRLGAKCREIRINSKVSAKEIAKICHKNVSDIYRFEAGKANSATIYDAYMFIKEVYG